MTKDASLFDLTDVLPRVVISPLSTGLVRYFQTLTFKYYLDLELLDLE